MADKLPELQTQEKLSPTLINDSGVSSALTKFAASTNALGEFGAKMAQSAATDRATKLGYEMGETPQGDLSPAITETDKAVISSYKAQSQSVLGLQAQKLINESQEAIADSPLTHESIASYSSTVLNGLKPILDMAPTGVRQSLEAQYASSLQNSIHQLNLKMISQVKQKNASDYSFYSSTAIQSIQSDAILHESDDTALLDNFNEYNDQSLSSGTINRRTYEANKESARIARLSGQSINKAIKAHGNQKLADYMATFSDIKNKPKDMSLDTWNAVGKNTASYMNKMISYKNAQDQQNTSELKLLAKNGVLTNSELSQRLAAMEPLARDKALLAVTTIQSKQQASLQKTNQILLNRDNAQNLSSYTPKDINNAHQKLSQHYSDAAAKNNEPNDPEKADLMAALDMATPVPAYVDRINHGVLFGSTEDILSASRIKKIFASENKSQLLNMSTEANAKLALFDLYHENGGMPAADAMQKATELTNIDETVLNARNAKWSEFSASNLNDSKSQTIMGRELTGLSNHWIGWFNTPLAQQDVMVRQALVLYKMNYRLTGSFEAAKKATTDSMKAKVSNTTINGEEEAGLNPITKIFDYGEFSNEAIWKDATEQLSSSLDQMKQQYDAGNLSYYYEVEKDSESVPPKVTKHFRNGGTQDFKLRIDSKPGELTTGGAGYNISLQSNLAPNLMFDQLPNAKNGMFFYSPNKNKIDANWVEAKKRGRERNKIMEKIDSTTPIFSPSF